MIHMKCQNVICSRIWSAAILLSAKVVAINKKYKKIPLGQTDIYGVILSDL